MKYLSALLAGFILCLSGCALKPSSTDVAEAISLRVCVIDNYPFALKSKAEPKLPPVECRYGIAQLFFSPPHHLVLYGITNTQDQETIVQIARKCRDENKIHRSITVDFYREENWTTTNLADGSILGRRGKEEKIRQVYLR